MSYRFSAMLHIPGDVRDAVAFYEKAFGATMGWGTPPAADMVAQLLIQGAEFWVHPEGATIGNPSPPQLGGTTVRLMLIVDDPDALFDRAVGAGAVVRSPMQDPRLRLARRLPPRSVWTSLGDRQAALISHLPTPGPNRPKNQ